MSGRERERESGSRKGTGKFLKQEQKQKYSNVILNENITQLYIDKQIHTKLPTNANVVVQS